MNEFLAWPARFRALVSFPPQSVSSESPIRINTLRPDSRRRLNVQKKTPRIL